MRLLNYFLDFPGTWLLMRLRIGLVIQDTQPWSSASQVISEGSDLYRAFKRDNQRSSTAKSTEGIVIFKFFSLYPHFLFGGSLWHTICNHWQYAGSGNSLGITEFSRSFLLLFLIAWFHASALRTGCLSFDRLQVGSRSIFATSMLWTLDRARNFPLSSKRNAFF